MKLFEEPIVEVKKYEVYDVLTSSDPTESTDEDLPEMIGLCLGWIPVE